MPIYAYRCAECGQAKDVLQKLSDPRLTTCPFCGAEAFAKQLTAAGFQLKGTGWYATDFKGGAPAAAKAEADGEGAKAKPEVDAGAAKPEGGSAAAKPEGGAAAAKPEGGATPAKATGGESTPAAAA